MFSHLIKMTQKIGVMIRRGRKIEHKLSPRGKFHVVHKDSEGNIKDIYDLPNGITNEGKDALLDIMFHADTQIDPWYIGLINNSGFTALAAADTHASHGGWTEFTDFDESFRGEWTEGAASSQSMTNASSVDFSINVDSSAINGIFIADLLTKGSTASGTLWSTGSFATAVAADDGDTLSITYTLNV